MKIDDIPLPPIVIGKETKNDRNNTLNVQRLNINNYHNIPMKRVVNHKLPVGLLLKDSFSKNNDTHAPKKELFLPNANDKIQLAFSSLKPYERESVATIFGKSHREYNESSKVNVDIKKSSKRRSNEKEDDNVTKRSRVDKRSRERKVENNISRVKSQVVVRDWGDSRRNNSSRHLDTRDKRQDYVRDRRHHSPARRSSKRQAYNSPRRRRSISRRRNRYSTHKYRRSRERNGHYKDKHANGSSVHRHNDSRKIVVYSKRKRSSSKKSSFASSTSQSSSSSSSSVSSNSELPIVSPRSPDDSPKKPKQSLKSPLRSLLHSPVQCPIVRAAAANVYLKQLKETLDKITVAYKTKAVVAQIPDQKICTDFELSSIPLPTEVVSQDITHKTIVAKSPVLVPVISTEHLITNGHRHSIRKRCIAGRIARSNSINADKLSCISDSTMGSKVYRSPLNSFNVSSYSKESENSDIKSRPVIPKINNFSINYSDIDPELLVHCSGDFITNKIRCHCTMPNPDQWNDDGFRACGHGQNCVLSQLRIECNNHRCPTEALCSNRQFQQLDTSSIKGSNAELFFDIRHSMSWKLRARSKTQRNRLLFEVTGRAAMADESSGDLEESESEILITKDIKLSLRSDHQSLIYYLKHGRREEANVYIEKWLVDGRIRVGVFALCEISPKTELVLFYRKDCVTVIDDSLSADNDDGILSSIKSLVHDTVTSDMLISLLDKLISPHNPSSVLDRCLRLGAIPLVYISSLQYIFNHCNQPLLTKLVDLVSLMPCDKNWDGYSLGLDPGALLDHLGNVVQSLGSPCSSTFDIIEKLRRSIIESAEPHLKYGKSESKSEVNNLYSLNCRLPTFWCSRECVCNEEARVFFYHKVTRFVQWDMPVYPWETNEDDTADIYDYNNASSAQVTHDEIAQMYLNLNKMYEIKQKRILFKENNPKPVKEPTEAHKKELFKKKMTDFIVRLLKPYRDAGCQEGRITSDEDLRYLANKLAQTILFKELKILNNVAEYLEVTTIVENKTKTYVRTYLQSRGTTYKRPSHQSDTIAKKVT